MHNQDQAPDASLDHAASTNTGPSDEDLVALGQDGGLLPTIFGGALVDDEATFIDRLVTLHNGGRIDLLALPLDQLGPLATHDYFDGHTRFYLMIPRLSGRVLPMIRLVNALVERAGDDLSSNVPNAAYRDWARAEPERAAEAADLALAGDPDALQVLRFSLEAGDLVELAQELLGAADHERRLPAVVALGQMSLDDKQARSALAGFKTVIAAYPDDNTGANILNSTIALGRRCDALEDPDVVEIVEAVLGQAGGTTHYAAAGLLNGAALPEPILRRLLDALSAVDRSHSATLRFLDTGLAKVLGGPHETLAEALMFDLLAVPDASLPPSAFKSSGRCLVDQPDERLSKTMTRWLLSERHLVRQALEKFLSAADRKAAMTFTLAGQQLTPIEQLLLCRRACGYFFIRPALAASVLVGVLREGDPEIRPKVAELLFDPLAKNYGGMTHDYLGSLDASDLAAPFVTPVLARVEARNAALGAIGFLDELEPSAPQRQMEAQHSASVMRTAYKEAERNSVFLNLVSRQVLLHGRGSMAYFRGPMDSADRSTVTQLHGQSYSYELPRDDVLDPVGLGLKILNLMHGTPRP